jgi:putative membrane protein
MKMKFMCSMLLIGAAALSHRLMHAQTASDQEQIFLTRASEADMAEIKQSQLALDKSTDPQVRDFAQKMITDHTALEDKMKPFAEKYSVTPVDAVNPDHQAELDKLSTLSGKAFDREYIASMEKDHRAALILFDNERTTSKDKELQAAADGAYSTVTMHIKMANKLADKLGVSYASDDTNP